MRLASLAELEVLLLTLPTPAYEALLSSAPTLSGRRRALRTIRLLLSSQKVAAPDWLLRRLLDRLLGQQLR